jgi:hypothetical protein
LPALIPAFSPREGETLPAHRDTPKAGLVGAHNATRFQRILFLLGGKARDEAGLKTIIPMSLCVVMVFYKISLYLMIDPLLEAHFPIIAVRKDRK